MNAEAERYLRQATRGLWGRRRREVREELAAHLAERVTAYRIGGLSECDATEKALVELGSPRAVSAGMARLYTLPTVATSGAVLAAVCVTLAAVLPKGFAQPEVLGSFYWPSAECEAALRTDSVLAAFNACRELDNSVWLDPQAFIPALEAQGVGVRRETATRRDAGVLTLEFPGATPIGVPLGAPSLVLSDGTALDVTFNMASDDMNLEFADAVIPEVPGALSLWNVLKAVGEQSAMPIRVEGDENPVVRLGDVSFRVGTKLRPVNGAEFYDSYLENVFFSDLSRPLNVVEPLYSLNPRVDIGLPLEETTLELDAAPGIYGVITLLDPDTLEDAWLQGETGSGGPYVSLEVLRPGSDPLVANLPEAPVRFVKAFRSDSKPSEAVVVRLGGDTNWYEVVSPEDIAVTAQN